MKKLSVLSILLLLLALGSTASAQEGNSGLPIEEEVIEQVDDAVEVTAADEGVAVEEALPAEEATVEEVEEAVELPASATEDSGVEEVDSLAGFEGEDLGLDSLGAGIEAAQLDDSEGDIQGAQLATGWVSYFQILNSGTSPANVTTEFYAEGSGTAIPGPSPTIAAGAVAQIDVSTVSDLGENFVGSGVVSSDQPVSVAVKQTISSGTNFVGGYSGISTGASTVYLPTVNRAFFGFETSIAIQAVSSTDGGDVAVSVTFTGNSADNPQVTTINETIPVNSMWYVDVSQLTIANVDGGARFNGSAIVTASNGEVAVVVTQENASSGNTISYEGFTAGANSLFAPSLFDNRFNFVSSLSLQNVSSVDNCVIATTYSNVADGVEATRTTTLNSGEAATSFQPDLNLNNGGQWTGSAQATTSTAGCEFVGTVNIATTASSGRGQAGTYSGLSGGSTTVGLPLLEKFVDNRFSGLTVQNVGTEAASFTVTFVDTTGTAVATVNSTGDIQPGANQLVTLNDALTDVPTGFSGGATVISAQPVAVIVNTGANQAGLDTITGDQTISYNGIGQ